MSNIIKKLKGTELDRNTTHKYGLKSGILWGHLKEENSCMPLLYISKPRSISQEDFEYILDRLQISLHVNPINQTK